MREIESKKLFYDEYLYKLSIHQPLAPIFRGKNFSNARNVLDRMQQDFEAGKPLFRTSYLRSTYVLPEELQNAQTLLHFLSKSTVNYKLRVDSSWLSLYSNENKFLENVMKKLGDRMFEYHRPNPSTIELIKESKNTIVVKKSIPYEYRVTLGEFTNPSFAVWSKKNPDKIKIGKCALDEIENNGYTRGFYFYARDKKIIQLLSLMIGDSIRRIDKVVCIQDLDK